MKSLHSKFLIIGLIMYSSKIMAQDYGNSGWDITLGYQYQKYHGIEIGIGHGSRGDELGSLIYRNYHICSEILLNNPGKNITGFKAGYSWSAVAGTVAGQAVYYTNFSKSSFALRPEIGLSLAGMIDFTYGYNFYLIDKLNQTGKHVFSAKVTIGQSTFKKKTKKKKD
ncbi:MAG: hypothetical protein HUU47_06170 [Bacteroidetes bacterium]|nr:hypothetical protein [Bacteroidota bacterium]